MPALDDLPRSHRAAVDAVASTVASDLDVAGCYLHGSAALGGFVDGRSDLDVLVIVGADPGWSRLRTVGGQLLDLTIPAPGLELSIVTTAQAGTPGTEPGYLLHVAGDDGTLIDGRGRHDHDLLLHYAVCRQAALPLLAGPPSTALIGTVPRPVIVERLRAELTWAMTHDAPIRYLVLNTCRARFFTTHDRFASKVEAGEWFAALATSEQAMVRDALAAQRGQGPDPTWHAQTAAAFAIAEQRRLLD